MTDNKNTIIAIILSAVVLIGWQYFISGPEQKAREEQAQLQQQKHQAEPAKQAKPEAKPGQTSQTPAAQPGAPVVPGHEAAPAAAAPAPVTRAEALKQSARVP